MHRMEINVCNALYSVQPHEGPNLKYKTNKSLSSSCSKYYCTCSMSRSISGSR